VITGQLLGDRENNGRYVGNDDLQRVVIAHKKRGRRRHRRGQRHQQLHEAAQEQGAVQVQTGTHAAHSSAMAAYGTSGENASDGAKVDILWYRPSIAVGARRWSTGNLGGRAVP